MRVQGEKDCIKQDAFLPFLSHTCLQKAISHKYEILWADFARLFPLGHLKINFSKEYFVFLDRDSLEPFLCMRGCFPLVNGAAEICASEIWDIILKGANKQAKVQFMQISSQDGVIRFFQWCARCSEQTEHTAGHREAAQSKPHTVAEPFPSVRGQSPGNCCCTGHRTAKPMG